MHNVLTGYVERGELPGFLTLVDRHRETFFDAVGYERDSIFPIASMTKPIAAVAAMILVEEGVLQLDDPVNELLPELSSVRVLRHIDSPLDDTVPARRAITLRDLLTFRLGTGLVFAEPGAHPIQAVLGKAIGFGAPAPATSDEFLSRLASLPVVCRPGDEGRYAPAPVIRRLLVP